MPPVKKAKAAKGRATAKENEAAPVISGQLDKKLKKQQVQQQGKKPERGVVFIKHLPHGFFEEQLQKYFQQFGNVTRLRLARSRRTGGSKNFAFVEFEYPEVAQVAAETMQNYLMFKKVVKTAYIPPEKQRFNYFKTSLKKVKNKAGKAIYVSNKTAAIQRKVKQHNDWSDDVYQKRTVSKVNMAKKLNSKYAHLGIDFSNIIVGPKRLTIEEKAQRVAAESKKKEDDSSAAAGIAKQTAAKEKRKATTKEVVETVQKKQKKANKSIGLEDLLGNTINEDSEDEDYIAMPESDASEAESNADDDDAATSDEETYGFAKDSGKDDESDSSEDKEAEVPATKSAKKSKTSFSKTVKPSKVDRFEQLTKRKPHVGGVQKLSKKPLKTPAVTKIKAAMQVAAAKEVAKPFSSLKNKKSSKKATKVGKKQMV